MTRKAWMDGLDRWSATVVTVAVSSGSDERREDESGIAARWMIEPMGMVDGVVVKGNDGLR